MKQPIWASPAEKLWYGGSGPGSFRRSPLSALLRIGEVLYRLWTAAVAALYHLGLLKTIEIPKPVISVGNLTVGGSGKSAFCLHLAGMLRERGQTAAIVSHSYGRSGGSRRAVVFAGGRSDIPPWREVGDEAAMMALGDPLILVAGGADKADSLREVAREAADVIIIDDAFHRKDINRDIDIVMVDAGRAFGNGRCLPRGPLREPVSSLSRASAFVVSLASAGDVPEELAHVLRSANPAAPIISALKVPACIEQWPGGGPGTIDMLEKLPVYAFCALGNPDSFLRSLDDAGAKIAGYEIFRDHHVYTEADLSRIAAESAKAGAGAVVTTAKDAVKISSWEEWAPPLFVLKVELLLGGETRWLEDRLDRIGTVRRDGNNDVFESRESKKENGAAVREESP